MASKANIVIDQGTTFNTTITLTDDLGNAIDLTGQTAYGQVRKWYTSSTSYSFTITIPTPSSGIIYVSMDANTTSSIADGRYVYDIATKSISGVITRIVEGMVTVTPEVTQIT